MRVTVIGTGFVGVVTAAVLSSFGNQVIGLDVDHEKIAKLKQSKVPFFEPGLEELLTVQQAAGNLTFTTDYQTAIAAAEVIMIAVGTPSTTAGGADLKYVLAATESLTHFLKDGAVVALKSTVPPGTLSQLEAIMMKAGKHNFFTASLPEFLKEGAAVEDTLHPDRIVIGATTPKTFEILRRLHQPFKAPILEVSPESAQMAKYAANAYLATRITFINQIADLCESNQANVQEVIAVIGKDQRIGQHYWYPGLGYGGSCFPKDVKELAYYSRQVGQGENLFNKIAQLNDQRIGQMMKKYAQLVGGWQGKQVAVLGLSFKPNTDDMREAPSLKVIPTLLEQGATVRAYDPQALESAQKVLPQSESLRCLDSLVAACDQADVIFALIEWPQIISFDFSQVRAAKTQWIFDTRNQLNQSTLTNLGYKYAAVGQAPL